VFVYKLEIALLIVEIVPSKVNLCLIGALTSYVQGVVTIYTYLLELDLLLIPYLGEYLIELQLVDCSICIIIKGV